MRQAIKPQMQLGEIDISAITFDAKSRDDIPRLLRALQHIWTNLELRNRVFQALDSMTTTNKKMGLSALFVSAKIVPEPLVYNAFRFPPVFSNDTDSSRITRPWSYRNPQC